MRIVHATDGAPRELSDARRAGFGDWQGYAAARRREALDALALAGVLPHQVTCLGVPDQRAAHLLAHLAIRLAARFVEVAPRTVLTHPYEGGHPDHDATAFAVHAAARLLQLAGRPAPRVLELTSYHLRDGQLATGVFLPAPGVREHCIALAPEAQALKRRMLACFRSQAETLAPFGVERERFRRAPRYRFTEPPHPGAPLYDAYPWGLRSAEWPDLVARACYELGLNPREPM